jgi:hypothetical protein
MRVFDLRREVHSAVKGDGGRFSPLGPVGIWGSLHQCSN